MSILIQQGTGGDQHPRRANAALRAPAFEKCLLKRIEAPIASESFYGENRRAIHLAHRNKARVDHFAVDNHRASSTLAFAAAFFGSGQAKVFTQRVEQP